MKKRLFSILTALCLCLTLVPTAALAADDTGAILALPGGFFLKGLDNSAPYLV